MNTKEKCYLLITVNGNKISVDGFEDYVSASNEMKSRIGSQLYIEGSGAVEDWNSNWINDRYFYGVLREGKIFKAKNKENDTIRIIISADFTKGQ